jgi:hypothetical protein
MKNPHCRHVKTVRLTIDFPVEQHAYLKMIMKRCSTEVFIPRSATNPSQTSTCIAKIGKSAVYKASLF